MTTLSFYMTQEGKLPQGIKDTLSRIFPSFAGKRLRLTIEEAKEKRSLDQNSYLYGVVEPHVRAFRAEMGDPVGLKEIHEDLLTEFAPTVTCKKLDGSLYARPMRSHEMSVEQMAAYITAISIRMIDFGNAIPEATHG